MRRIAAILCVSLACVACQPRPVRSTPAPRGDALLFVYLQPLPREAGPLTIEVRSISALREDAPPVPLTLRIEAVDRAELERERLFATGSLPAGRYVGLALEIEQASLRDEEDHPALAVPAEPASIDVAFTVSRKRGIVVSLQLDHAASAADGFTFRPVFHAEIPGQLAAGLTALATSRALDAATIFDKSTGHVVGVVPLGRRPSGMALARERLRAYVAISGDDSIEVIDIVERTIIDRLRLDGGDAPVELALTPDGSTLLCVNAGSDSLSFIDADTLFEIDRIAVGNGPNSVLVDSSGQRAYVFNALGDSISVVDLPRRSVIAAIRSDAEPLRGQFSPDGSLLYVIHRLSPYLVVIDPATLESVNRVYVGAAAEALKIDSRTGWIYVARRGGGGVEIFDPASLLPIGILAVDGNVSYATIDGETNNMFLVLPQANGVRSLALAGQRTAAEVDVGGDPYWVTMMGER